MEGKPKMSDAERHKLVEKLNRETDEYIQEAIERNKDYKYEDGFTSENIDEILATHPAFMTEQPTQEQIDRSPMLQALQAIQYDDEEDTLEEKATALKKDGNFQFKCKKYRFASKAYTEALRMKFEDNDLRAALFFNRSAANYNLQNFRSSLLDASAAVKLNPEYIKALLKCAQSCKALKRYQDAMDWCRVLLSLDEDHNQAEDIFSECKTLLQTQQRDARKKQRLAMKERERQNRLLHAIAERGINLALPKRHPDDSSDDEDSESKLKLSALETHDISNSAVHLDEKGCLVWPVLFVYPEHKTTDIIQEFHESSSFRDHLNVVFEQPPDWDEKGFYKSECLEVFYENKETEKLHKVDLDNSLFSVLKEDSMVVQAGTPNFLILSHKSPFYNHFISRHGLN